MMRVQCVIRAASLLPTLNTKFAMKPPSFLIETEEKIAKILELQHRVFGKLVDGVNELMGMCLAALV